MSHSELFSNAPDLINCSNFENISTVKNCFNSNH